MNKKSALVLFVGICILDAILILTHSVSVVVGACIFAVALALFGGASRGFRKP